MIMPWNREKRSLYSQASMEGFTGPDATRSTFSDTYPAFLAKTIHSELSISRYLMEAPKRERNDNLFRMIRDGEIEEDIVLNFVNRGMGAPDVGYTYHEIDFDALASFVVESGIADVQTTEQIDESIKSEVHFYENIAADLASRASLSGKAGAFVGGMHAGMLDPINVGVSLAVPAAGPASTLWGTAVRHAAIGAGANLVAEALIQPVIMGYKSDLDLEYTFSDALTNASLSAIMGGTISGASGALGHAVSNSLNNARAARARGDIDTLEAWEAAYQIARQMEVESKNAPEPDIPPQVFDKNVVRAGEAIDQGTNVPVRQTVEPIDNIDAHIAEQRQRIQEELDAERAELLTQQVDTLEEAVRLQTSERGGVGLAEPGNITAARARFQELEDKMAIAITCIKGQ